MLTASLTTLLITAGAIQRALAGTEQLVKRMGLPVEKHRAVTSDGYVLTMFRIPANNTNSPVAFLQHGLIASSADWVILGPGKSLAHSLVTAGYDVWMGNFRGNTISRKHVSLDPAQPQFWDFSWHEIGLYDLPAMIDYVLKKTGQKTLHYVGHSQGTTAFFVMASMKPEYNSKILSMQALAPIAFMGQMKSPFIRAIAPFSTQIEWTMRMLGVNELLPSHKMMIAGGQKACEDTSTLQEVCVNVIFLICGYDSAQLNRTLLPTIVQHTPAGASVKQLAHYAQGINSGRFRQFDHGVVGNVMNYGSSTPPSYPLKRITAPVFLHYGDNDWLAAVSDVRLLYRQLGNGTRLLRVPEKQWNHLDFIYATGAKSLLYNRVMDLMNRYNNAMPEKYRMEE
ncbi:AAEL012350-PA [Aedes aegypti]|uniref:Lipase n=2 Tax=Aedes aegypti TaxID=7159 RepID=Q16MC6_AEDAE|nr:lipase 3 [Aedes aegypti]XP_021694069.1 lipase 3 [Aedes aegypti]EAT35491.1 AAEL012350-PA [Aedes aegypti]